MNTALQYRCAPPPIERLVPDELSADDITGKATLELHVARYEFAARHAHGRVLDIACGVGYGTRLLADRGSEAVGVDLDREAIAYATKRYGCAGVTFVAGDALAFQDGAGFDTIVSLETIEHVTGEAQRKLLAPFFVWFTVGLYDPPVRRLMGYQWSRRDEWLHRRLGDFVRLVFACVPARFRKHPRARAGLDRASGRIPATTPLVHTPARNLPPLDERGNPMHYCPKVS